MSTFSPAPPSCIAGKIATAREVKATIWTIHERQTRQLVQEVWGRADFIRDQATLQSQAAEASRRSREDSVTGLGNRQMLEHFLKNEAPGPDQDLALILIDVDHFKEINGAFGFRIGDDVVRRIGRLLRDEVQANRVAVRYDGDEFVLGLRGGGLPTTADLAERMRRTIDELDWNMLSAGLRVTASLGVAAGSRLHSTAVFSAADAALRAAKSAGGNPVVAAPELGRSP